MPWIELPTGRSAPGFTARAREPHRWFEISNNASDVAEVRLFDEIGGWGVYADEFVEQLNAITAPKITLRLNSPGGSVFEGIAAANALRAHPAEVTVKVEGLAASIASVIALAGDRVIVMPQSMMMIHDASGGCWGQAADMIQMSEMLDKLSDNIADAYAERAGGTRAEWRARMGAETWYLAEEAVAAGLADEVGAHAEGSDEPVVTNSWDLSVFRYAGREHAPAPLATAVGPHSSTAKEGAWDGPGEEKKLPSPVPVATARNMYGWYDGDQVEDGHVAKSACKLPHHFVNDDGTPGAASVNGVRNALARLPQTHGLTDDERSTIERHLHGHLPADDAQDRAPTPVQGAATQTPPAEPAAGPAITDQEEDSMSTLSEGLRERLGLGADAELDDDALLAALDEQLAAVTAPPADAPAEPEPEPIAARIPDGTVLVDVERLAQLEAQAAEGVAARAQQRVEARDRALDEAVADGKFPPSRREHYAAAWDRDPEGTRDLLDILPKNVVPLADVGQPGGEPTDDGFDAEVDRIFSTPGRSA